MPKVTPKGKPAKAAPAPAKRPAKASPSKAPPAPAKRPAKAPPAPAKARPAPAPAPAPAPPAPAPAPAVQRQPLGVYLNHNRNTAIAFKHTDHGGLWYLTIITGQVTIEHCSEEKFRHDWDIPFLTYPFRRAVKVYKESLLTRDEQTDKVMNVLLRNT